MSVDGLALNGARWLMLAALVFAPWACGATEPWAVTILNQTLLVVIGLWAFGCLVRRSWPEIPGALVGVSLALMGWAWFMALNAGSDYDSARREWTRLEPWLPAWPGSVNQSASVTMAWRVSALLGAACFVCDLARRSTWRQRLLATLAGNGTALVLFGLVQRLADAPSVFWSELDFGKTFFATYRYHSNAGAFLNLTWPIVACFAALAWMRTSSWRNRLGWSGALVICLAGVLVNASRAASVLALLLGAVWSGWLVAQAARGRIQGVSPAVAAVTGGLLLLLIVAVAAMAGLDTTVRRWNKFDEELSSANPRLQVAGVCLAMARESRWFGFGPGSWQSSFPYFSSGVGDRASGIWEHAHNDYLETIIDWGFVGSGAWVFLVLGGIIGSCVRRWRQRAGLSDTERVTHFAVMTALAGLLLHAVVDFPLQIASLQITFVSLLGLAWASRQWLGEGDQRSRHHRRGHAPVTGPHRSY